MARDDPPRKRAPRGNWTPQEREPGSRKFIARDPFERFREKCRFDPSTGCVVWIGGRTRGRGNTAEYGSFKFEGRRWFAHRWAAVYIHGLDVDGVTVGHCCPHTHDGNPNSLCVQHLRPETLRENTVERNVRVAANARQSNAERQLWLLVEIGAEPAPPVTDPDAAPDNVPFYDPPDWLQAARPDQGDCPF